MESPRSLGWEHLSLPCAPWVLGRSVPADDPVMAGCAYGGTAIPHRHVVRLDGRRMTTVRDAVHELSAALQLVDDLPGYGANLIAEALEGAHSASGATELVLVVAFPDRVQGVRSLVGAADLAGSILMHAAIAFHAVFETRSDKDVTWLRRELTATGTTWGQLPSTPFHAD